MLLIESIASSTAKYVGFERHLHCMKKEDTGDKVKGNPSSPRNML